MRIVVAPDKFKGTLTGPEAAEAMVAGARSAFPEADVVVVPSADGGEGTISALLAGVGGRVRRFRVSGPAGTEVLAPVASLVDGRLVVESATACGLGLLDAPDPTHASSLGVGELILHARDLGPASPVVVGVGGTASTDGGTGAAIALGWRFVDRDGRALEPGGAALERLHAIDATGVDGALRESRISAACDVSNPLTGEQGAARVFGPQKGASASEVEVLERGLDRLAEVVGRELGLSISNLSCGGAGGGLGAGLAAFFGAELLPGSDAVASAPGLAEEIARADVVLTGEGRIDVTTAGGKVVDGVVRLAGEAGVRCVVVAGESDRAAASAYRDGGAILVSLVERFGDRSRREVATCVTEVVAEVFRV